MKKTKLFNLATTVALSSTVLLGAAPVFAEEARIVDTEGSVGFEGAEPGGEEVVVVPPEGEQPPVVIPPIVPGATGPLTITFAPQLDFGNHPISSVDQYYKVLAEQQYLDNENLEKNEEGEIVSGDKVPYVSFAQVLDTRGTNRGWTLSVSMPEQFINEDAQHDTLTGAQIKFSNPRIQYEGSVPTSAPSAHAEDLVVIPEAGAVVVMDAAETKGAGVSSIVWGNQTELNEAFEAAETAEEKDLIVNEDIELYVPGTTIKDEGVYATKLVWELTTGVENGD